MEQFQGANGYPSSISRNGGGKILLSANRRGATVSPPSPHPVRRLRSFLKEDGARAGECLVGVGTRFEAMRALGQGAKRETVFSTIFHTTTTLARFSYRMLVLPIIVRPSVGPSIRFSAPHLVSRCCSLVLSHHVFLSSLFACFHNL